jgi:hypothetical protein
MPVGKNWCKQTTAFKCPVLTNSIAFSVTNFSKSGNLSKHLSTYQVHSSNNTLIFRIVRLTFEGLKKVVGNAAEVLTL